MKGVLILVAATLVFPLGPAENKPNFSGKWALDTQRSDFGEGPSPDSQINVIEHREPKIKLRATVKGDAIPGGEATSERQYTTDGKENTNKVGEHELKSTTRWDDNKLVTTTKLETPDGAVEINDTWELTAAGKQMVVTRNFKGPHGERKDRLVFTSQN